MNTPPKLFPTIAIPEASPRFVLNQWLTTASDVVVNAAAAGPASKPRHSMKCQYALHSASRKMLTM